MAVSLKPLSQQVIVITGASSGIGLATARAAVAKGAKVVLAARNPEALQDLEQEITNQGGQAVHVVADVANQEEVQQIARVAIERFGGFDTWVNNAGISVYGRLGEISLQDHKRLYEVNFWGTVYGSLIAAEHLKHRGGAIINMGSVGSEVAMPLQGMYTSSKHAILGFTDALRMELEQEGAPVSVTLIKPSGINTPLAQHAKNYLHHEPKLPPPTYEPKEVVYAVLQAATHPHRDIYVGSKAKIMSTLNKYAPKLVDLFNEKVMIKNQYRNEPARTQEGSLYQAGKDGHVRGIQPGYVMKNSFYTRAILNPAVTGAIVVVGGLVALAIMGGKVDGKRKG